MIDEKKIPLKTWNQCYTVLNKFPYCRAKGSPGLWSWGLSLPCLWAEGPAAGPCAADGVWMWQSPSFSWSQSHQFQVVFCGSMWSVGHTPHTN